MGLDPLTKKKLKRFRSIKRGYYSLIILIVCVVLAIFAELIVNKKAIIVKYNGEYHFPTYRGEFYLDTVGGMKIIPKFKWESIPGQTFGLDYSHETNYRNLQKQFKEEDDGNFVIMPIIPYGPQESDYIEGDYAPYEPSFEREHYLGTDPLARDILARLVYGFRIAIFFAFLLTFITFVVGIIIGCLMGYFGGWFDLLFQRLIEIWSNIPFLYVVMIVASIVNPSFWTLTLIMVVFGWTSITWYLRTSTYKEKGREYVLAAKALGASHWRVIVKHIIPNTIAVIITFIPFSISSAIVGLTSLDYLGYGLPAPTPSWGELLRQGSEYINEKWILGSVIAAMVLVLTLVTFIGEAVREAFDPKKHTVYE